MVNRRTLERFDLKIPARVEGLDKRKAGDVLDLTTSDICSGGAFFHTEECLPDQCLPEGTKVSIELTLPLQGLKKLFDEYDHARIKVTGTILRKEERGVAVCFDKGYSIRPRRKRSSIRH